MYALGVCYNSTSNLKIMGCKVKLKFSHGYKTIRYFQQYNFNKFLNNTISVLLHIVNISSHMSMLTIAYQNNATNNI